MTEHTKGPWTVGRRYEFGTRNACMVYDADGDAVALIYGLPQNAKLESFKDDPRFAEWLANAYLMAAAPTMFQALEAIERLFADDQERIDKTFQQVADALHAAKGQS